jgi:hypothetical protein
MVRQSGFPKQNGENQAFNHAGNVVGVGLSGLLGWKFGLRAIVWLESLFGLLSIISVWMIPAHAIDNDAARGMREDGKGAGRPSGFQVLLECKPLLILAAALACFHLGNGAMLPLYGLTVVSTKQGDPAAFIATTIVVAQTVMIVMALVAMRMMERRGYWFSFLALPLRGFLAAHLIESWGVFPVQIVDGVSAGLQSVALPGLVARILNNTGRVNVGQGALMTIQGIGASLSPAIGGWIAQEIGFGSAFMILSSFAMISIVLWSAFVRTLKPACAP